MPVTIPPLTRQKIEALVDMLCKGGDFATARELARLGDRMSKLS